SELSSHAQSSIALICEGLQERLAEIIHPAELDPKYMDFASIRKRLVAMTPPAAPCSGEQFADAVMGSISMLPSELRADRRSVAAAANLSPGQVSSLLSIYDE